VELAEDREHLISVELFVPVLIYPRKHLFHRFALPNLHLAALEEAPGTLVAVFVYPARRLGWSGICGPSPYAAPWLRRGGAGALTAHGATHSLHLTPAPASHPRVDGRSTTGRI